jgi:hypothetical protein
VISSSRWLTAIRRYLIAVAFGNLLWEVAQLPLYTLWREGTAASMASAVLHCTVGDLVIAIVAIVTALAIFGSSEWPDRGRFAVGVTAVCLGIAYTMFSEYRNAVVVRSWTYTELMPMLPWVGTGLAPLAQWIVVPSVALVSASMHAAD